MRAQAGKWQRWRVALTAYNRYMDLAFVDAIGGPASAQCEIALLSKDGVYLMEIPRAVPGMLIPTGGRCVRVYLSV